MVFRLKYIRDKNNLTQKEVANILKISTPNYNYFENQERVITLKHLNNFCNYFKVSMDFALGISNINVTSKEITFINAKLVGERIRYVRLSKNLTQKELADIINTSQSTISSYEKGNTLIITAFLIEMCKRLDVSTDYITGRNNILKIHRSL